MNGVADNISLSIHTSSVRALPWPGIHTRRNYETTQADMHIEKKREGTRVYRAHAHPFVINSNIFFFTIMNKLINERTHECAMV